MELKFKKLHEDAVLPSYAKDGDAGLDLVCVDNGSVSEDFVEYKLGIAVEIPEGYVGLIFPRSSITKKSLLLKNSVGVIDSGYRGEIMARYHHTILGYGKTYSKGDKIAQLIIMPYPTINPKWADELSDTVRGANGFGSTGN
jgi:dUTP pyrophosphatase